MILSLFSCEGTNFFEKSVSAKPLAISDTNDDGDNVDNVDDLFNGNPQDIEIVSGTTHAMFSGKLGQPISRSSMGAIDPDPSGHTACNDYDGDGIPNNQEIVTSPFVADFPKIVTRISAPITMEIRKSTTDTTENYIETIEDTDIKDTISDSMESKQYAQLNTRTTQAGKASNSTLNEHNSNYGTSIKNDHGFNASNSFKIPILNMAFGSIFKYNNPKNKTHQISDKLNSASNTEKIIFEDIDYRDNLDRNGVEFKNDTIQNMAQRFRRSQIGKKETKVGPNAGFVRTNLFIKNLTVNIPALVYDVKCTLSFRTPGGNYLPIKTFYLKNEHFTDFSEQIYGNEELGPFVIEVNNLNTEEVRNALAKGYTPQIHVVSYKLKRIPGSTYNPGVENLKLVEENVKGRTAQIKIVGPNMREIYRVAAFDVNSNGDLSPGISLKKALFHISKDRVGYIERWNSDEKGNYLTVKDDELRWRSGLSSIATINYPYSSSMNNSGNTWRNFETFIKSYKVTEKNANGELEVKTKYIELIKRIKNLTKYNPYNKKDNPEYDSNKDMDDEKLNQMGYWIILHNGKYFEGDINDAIWVGERYEIIYIQVKDFNDHFSGHAFTPIQTETRMLFDSRWNRYSNQDNLARTINLGKIIKDDVVKLEVDISASRFLFNRANIGNEMGNYLKIVNNDGTLYPGYVWHNYNYTFDDGKAPINGIPTDFTYNVEAGTNSFKVKINPGKNITEYSIRFWKNIDGEHHLAEGSRWVHITTEQLTQQNNVVYINRSTFNERYKLTVEQPDKHSNQPEHVGHIDNDEYSFRVYGYGNNNGIFSYKLSSSGLIKVTPKDPNQYDSSDDVFDAQVNADTNKIAVDISGKDNAEGFIIRVYGPLNYGGTYETKNFKDYYGHDGNNIIAIDTPPLTDSLKVDEKNLNVPGYYYVYVYAFNKNSLDENGNIDLNKCRMHKGEQRLFVNVPFEKYKEQKSFLAKKNLNNFDPRAVDLEVNFNDGSGWFRLKLSSNDKGANGKEIDCRKTTNIDYQNQKVTIFFKAPTANTDDYSQNQTYNVFRGGKNEVDVYLRVVPKPEFRDTIWPKTNINASFDINKTRGIYVKTENINSLSGMDFLHYWITNPFTDATYIDDYKTGSFLYNTYDDINNNSSYNSFGIKAATKNEFFFSPLEQRLYGIKSSIVNRSITAMMKEVNHVDSPSYRVIAGDKRIEVFNLDSQYASSFNIRIIPGNHLNDTVDIIGEDWQIVSSDLYGKYVIENYKGEDLKINTSYTIAVQAINEESSTSSGWVKKKVVTTIPRSVVTIEDAGGDVNVGFFGTPSQRLYTNALEMLQNGVHFMYNEPLIGGQYDIYNTGTSNIFENGKYFSIIVNGRNVADSFGLNLTPIAKDLSFITTGAPSNQVWIDPVSGKFILPRPIYWSKCESEDNMQNPDIGLKNKYINTSHIPKYSERDGKWNWGIQFETSKSSKSNQYFPTFYQGKSFKVLNKGTYSVWCKRTHGRSYMFTEFGYFRVYFANGGLEILINGVKVFAQTGVFIYSGDFDHFQIIWDIDKGINGGKSIAVYQNGIEIGSSTEDFGASDYYNNFYTEFRDGSSSYNTGTTLDNIKLWDYVIEDLSWLYNGNMGYENGLDIIYGANNNYYPNITGLTGSVQNGVGYYTIPSND